MSSYDEKSRYPLISVMLSADVDFDADLPATYYYEGMLFHNTMIRGLNSIYYYAPRVKPGDEGDFAVYCLGVLGAIYGHQDHGLKKIFFPVLQKKYDMTQYSAHYASYRPQMNALNEYMTSVANKGPFDGQKVRELLEIFGDNLVKNLHDLVVTGEPQRLKEYDPKEIQDMLNHHRALLDKLLQETPTPVFVISHHDVKTAPSWPAQAKTIGPVDQLDAYKANTSVWRFAPYTVQGDGETQTYS